MYSLILIIYYRLRRPTLYPIALPALVQVRYFIALRQAGQSRPNPRRHWVCPLVALSRVPRVGSQEACAIVKAIPTLCRLLQRRQDFRIIAFLPQRLLFEPRDLAVLAHDDRGPPADVRLW
jgi:hypothetical protein